jgi:hypothetical protein
VRLTLPLCPAPRTPARPGFGVSGYSKSACFDQSPLKRPISFRCTPDAVPQECPSAERDALIHRLRSPRHPFERVQTSPQELRDDRSAPVQVRRPSIQSARKAYGRTPVSPSVERVQMHVRGEMLRPLPYPLTPFECVQTSPQELRDDRSARVQIGRPRIQPARKASGGTPGSPSVERVQTSQLEVRDARAGCAQIRTPGIELDRKAYGRTPRSLSF